MTTEIGSNEAIRQMWNYDTFHKQALTGLFLTQSKLQESAPADVPYSELQPLIQEQLSNLQLLTKHLQFIEWVHAEPDRLQRLCGTIQENIDVEKKEASV